MTNRRIWIAACGLAMTIAAAAAAQQPSVLATAAPGLWELSGLPESGPVRECVASLSALAQYEHRGRGCAAVKTLTDSGKVAVLYYTCAGSDFGRTSMKVITPRNLKVDTQGISDGLPFAYAFEARRVGDCKAPAGAAERGH